MLLGHMSDLSKVELS
jgi:transposase InsO family protein